MLGLAFRILHDVTLCIGYWRKFIWTKEKSTKMNKNQYKHFREPVETKIMQMRIYQFKLTKNVFLSRGYEHVSSLARWNRLYIDTKILLSQTTYRDIFSIETPRYYVAIKAFFMQAAHFQCCHYHLKSICFS